MNKIFIALIFLTGCATSSEEYLEEVDTIQNIDKRVIYDNKVAGSSFFPGCGFYKEHPPVIDPDWSETSVEYIRAGVKLWENALGIDLGDVPVSDEDCSRDNRVPSCIVKMDEYRISGEDPSPQIFLYTNLLVDHNYSPAYLTDLTAHEVGHYLMISHTESGVMATNRHLTKNPQITEADVIGYEEACVK